MFIIQALVQAKKYVIPQGKECVCPVGSTSRMDTAFIKFGV